MIAIAVLSRLAEAYSEEGRLSAQELSTARDLPNPFVAKILSTLSAEGLVSSVRGPGGGFALARPPAQITLFEVVSLFERSDPNLCPVGGGICGVGKPCPVHDRLSGIRRQTEAMLQETTFEVFATADQQGPGTRNPARSSSRR